MKKYVPKVGDKVVLNPAAMALAPFLRPSLLFVSDSDILTIGGVWSHDRYPTCLLVGWYAPGGTCCGSPGVAIDNEHGAFWAAAEALDQPPPLFLPASGTCPVPDGGLLKRLNTEADRTECAACGTPLRNIGWRSMQYCPKCES